MKLVSVKKYAEGAKYRTEVVIEHRGVMVQHDAMWGGQPSLRLMYAAALEHVGEVFEYLPEELNVN